MSNFIPTTVATLKELEIRGIRNFGPKTQKIEFTTPITLVLGQNGCGKTALIESIKYACTQESPAGTGRGRGFIHKPQSAKSNSTSGHIKLEILKPEQDGVIIRRGVVCGGATPRCCTKTSSITIQEIEQTGSGDVITKKCCEIMGASPVVLNNVVFCHQGNSAWPVDNPKKLKEVFDEVFGVDKYNKCVETLKNRQRNADLKVRKLKEQRWKTMENKDRTQVQLKLLKRQNAERRLVEDEIQSKLKELESVKKQIEEVDQIQKMLGDLATKKRNKNDMAVQGQDELSESERDGGKIEKMTASLNKNEKMIEELEKKVADVDKESRANGVALQESQNLLKRLSIQKDGYVKKCLERDKLIERARNEFGVLLPSRSVLDDIKAHLQRLCEQRDAEEKELEASVEEMLKETERTREMLKSKKEEIKEREEKIIEIEEKMRGLVLGGDSEVYAESIKTIDEKISTLKFRKTEQGQATDEIESMERNLDELERENRILQQNEAIEIQIKAQESLAEEKQKELTNIRNEVMDNLTKIFYGTVPKENCQKYVSTLQKNAEVVVKNLTEKIKKSQKVVTALEVDHQKQKEEIATCEKKIRDNEEKILELCQGRDLKEMLKSTVQTLESLKSAKEEHSSVKVIYQRFIEKFEKESPCCPICETSFVQGDQAVRKIVAVLKDKVDSVPQDLIFVERELQQQEDLYKKLQQLDLINDEVELLKTQKLPRMRQRLEETSKSLDDNKTDLEEVEMMLSDSQNTVETTEKILAGVRSLTENHLEIQKINEDVGKLKQQLSASNRPKEQVEAEIDSVKMKICKMRRRVDEVAKTMERDRETVSRLEQEKECLLDKQKRLMQETETKRALEDEKNELRGQVSSLQREEAELSTQLYFMENEWQGAVENRERTVQKNRQQIENAKDKLRIVTDIERVGKEIDEYGEIEGKVKKTEEQLEEYKNKSKHLGFIKNETNKTLSQEKIECEKLKEKLCTLKNQRKKLTRDAELQREIEHSTKLIGDYTYASAFDKRRQLNRQWGDLERQIATKKEAKKEMTRKIEQMNKMIRTLNGGKDYTSNFYELKVAENVAEDLTKYIEALEGAILEAHTSQIAALNRLIRKLWRNVYNGNDVDYVEIKVDFVSSSEKKRNYFYRVVQVTGARELDMQGHCSAGQKFLACLVIRMALAELSSPGCGILALDEPTTSLDRETVQNLSDTLSRVVNVKGKNNFQLLVVTHDEEFLKALTRAQSVPHYYTVHRNQASISVIKKEYA